MSKSIRKKLIIHILPIILIILFWGCALSVLNSKKLFKQEMYQTLLLEQDKRAVDIESKISKIKGSVDTFANNIKNTYTHLNIDIYTKILTDTVSNNSNYKSYGIWFEPYTINSNQKYAHAYVENFNGEIALNDFYSSENFDYLNNDLYKRCKETNSSFFDDAYYDVDSNSYYIIYVTPIKDENGNFLGCVSVAFNNNDLNKYVAESFNDSINFYILNNSGFYLAHSDSELVSSRTNLLDTNNSYGENVQSILNTDTGIFSYKQNNEKYYVYYTTVSEFQWKFVYEIPESLVNKPLINIILVNIFIFIVTLSAIIGLIFFFSGKFVNKPFKLLLDEFKNISNNNFDSEITEQLLNTDTEFCEVGEALIDMKLNLNDYQNALVSKNQLLLDNEKILTETVNYVNAIISALPVMMFVLDRDGYCLECHGIDSFTNMPPSFYAGKHCFDFVGAENVDSQHLSDFLNIVNTIDYSDGIVRIELPLLINDNLEFFEHTLVLCRDNEVISLCRRTTDDVNYMENMKYLSSYDELTGVYNTRYFNDILKNYKTQVELPISIVALDVNGLKSINDTYGHRAGDRLLIKLTNALSNINIPNKVIARIAGDKFAVLLPNTSKTDAENIFENINSKCASHKVYKIPFSISFGVDTAKSSNDHLLDVNKSAEEFLYKQKLYSSSSQKDNTIELINSTLLAKNQREQLHSNRVSALCVEMAKALGWSTLDQNKIRTAGLLHDIGKIGISDALLNKPGALNDNEYKEMCTHPEIGYRILQSSSNMKELSEYAYSHHEKWDGTGYPRQLKGTEIVIEARIISIVDTYDAMTRPRSYRDALPKQVAISELIKCKNTQFDPELVDIFVEKVLHENLEDYQNLDS